MITVVERENPNALDQVYAEVDKVLAAMREVGAERLDRNLAAGGRSGVHYAGQPRTSSAPGEFPQEQRGVLRSMVASGQSGLLEHWFGLDPKGKEQTEQALALEMGAPRNNLVARAPVRRTASDPSVHAEMVAKAIRR